MIENFITNETMQFGAFGVIVAFYAFDKYVFHKDFKRVIENNTIALTRVYEKMKK